MGDFFAFDGGQKWKVCDLGTVTAPGGNNSKGAYSSAENTQKTTSSGFIVSATQAGTLSRSVLMDIAVDPANDPIVNNILISQGASAAAPGYYYFPMQLPRGSKLYARYQMSGSGATMAVRILTCPSSLFSSGFHDCDTYGVSTTTSLGTVITPGGSWVKGAYAALTTNILSDVKGFSLNVAHNGFDILAGSYFWLDVATGVGSPTSILINNLPVYVSGSNDIFHVKSHGPFMVPIAHGHGLWVRAVSDIASPDSFCMAVYCLR